MVGESEPEEAAPTVLHIHRAERADGLVDALGDLLIAPPADPLAGEVIAVPTRGMERWLTQRLSARLGARPGHADGVCANVAFPSPHRLVAEAVAVACGVDPQADPWLAERVVWSLLEVVDACLAEPWLRGLCVHLGGDSSEPDPVRRARRLSTVRHVAELYDRYALHRPEMLRAWAAGSDTGGDRRDLPADTAWQAELWRRLRARLGLPGPAERLDEACAAIGRRPDRLSLPGRLALFGLTRIPAGHLRVLRAIAGARDVHVLVLHPSPALWDRVRAEPRAPTRRRAADPTVRLPENRLLASWGSDAREMELVLLGHDDPSADHHHPVARADESLLARIQSDVRSDRAPPGAPLPGEPDSRPALDAGDRSVQVHACHGRARQVEVARDAILHLLADDPSLEPRDVIVMCPDIETFAPLIAATFGAGEVADDDDAPAAADPLPAGVRPCHHRRWADLRVRLADRSLRQTNPVLGVVSQLLELPGQRLTATQVLDLADREPVRRRLELDDDDLTRIHDWVAASGIRWGLDAAHRAPFKLEALSAGTWRAGLDRILTGVAMTEDDQRLFAGVLPLDDVESGAIDLAGRLAELIGRLRAALDGLTAPQPLAAWAESIGAAADALTATSRRDAWQRAELDRLLADIVGEAGGSRTSIALAELRALLAGRLQGRPTRANFRTGHLTICTMVPMRSVPHRVVCLLGLDDGVFPRQAPRDGDDLMGADPHVGDRDPRSEDRQMLLDALLAAGDRLIVTYTGNDERTNAPRPPAVPLGELLDTIDATVRVLIEGAVDGRARERVVVRHPLQPFDPRNFTDDSLAHPGSWSFDAVTLAGARAMSAPRSAPAGFLAGPLGPAASGIVETDRLVRFVAHPVRAFLRQRLGISVGDYTDVALDDLGVELDGLGKWSVGQRLVDARLAGVDARTAVRAEIARGMLPAGALGRPVIDEVFPIVEAIVAEADRLVAGRPEPASVDVHLRLADGRLLSGTVPGISRDVLRTATYSRVGPRHRMSAWVRLLAVVAAAPERRFTAATVGRASGRSAIKIVRIRPPGDEPAARRAWALGHLETIVDIYDRGMREPLPLYCLSSAAYAEAVRAGVDPVAAGRREWTSEWNFDKEDRSPEHQLVLGGVRPFAELLAVPPRPDERWEAEEATRVGQYARRLWAGLLAAEEVSAR
ncbi:MAG: exodeoxyribonuclease V subunit gamma [Actinobacteria bacterium]|nr:exodeoxyribonuclease V subunit gamma [Actinomycetota bacterium]